MVLRLKTAPPTNPAKCPHTAPRTQAPRPTQGPTRRGGGDGGRRGGKQDREKTEEGRKKIICSAKRKKGGKTRCGWVGDERPHPPLGILEAQPAQHPSAAEPHGTEVLYSGILSPERGCWEGTGRPGEVLASFSQMQISGGIDHRAWNGSQETKWMIHPNGAVRRERDRLAWEDPTDSSQASRVLISSLVGSAAHYLRSLQPSSVTHF